MIVFVLAIVVPLGILGFQTWDWIRVGEWHSISVANVLFVLGVDLTPLYYPDDWIGLAKIGRALVEAPLALGSLFLGIVSWYITDFIEDSWEWLVEHFRRSRSGQEPGGGSS